ncbi:dimethylhistidine N-methyltransferase [Alloalcanivorax xenomutans]|uniref:L-histidine N(alpha)-methyltransferase n=1 Tax=Alloalcanivorax xenomutans TaxID=1094342 RepID=UPI000BCA8FEA|nr:L-histidine N(alpha)-methyltransferase [Alloalcanivorax xenomutans]SOC18229.1 dimethylhistidine N-methyltransferase [Alloalcanivorax xenomutans]
MQPRQLLPNLTFLDLYPPTADAAREVLSSLSAATPHLDPKYFYDEQGSALFDAITRTPEYYPTRTETRLLREHARTMARTLDTELTIVEPGAGGCEKARILLDQWQPRGYMPLEISRECLLDATRQLAPQYPQVQFQAVCADYSQALTVPTGHQELPRLVFFPGSTIGNFEPVARRTFLADLRQLAGDDGFLLIGADLHKSPERLHQAYNDSAGHTAAFNLNILAHLNRRLDCGFDLDAFEHQAFYNEDQQRVEMHLQCHRDQHVRIAGKSLTLSAGTRVHTENSYKFSVEDFSRELVTAGFQPLSCWLDDEALFSVHLARAA